MRSIELIRVRSRAVYWIYVKCKLEKKKKKRKMTTTTTKSLPWFQKKTLSTIDDQLLDMGWGSVVEWGIFLASAFGLILLGVSAHLQDLPLFKSDPLSQEIWGSLSILISFLFPWLSICFLNIGNELVIHTPMLWSVPLGSNGIG